MYCDVNVHTLTCFGGDIHLLQKCHTEWDCVTRNVAVEVWLPVRFDRQVTPPAVCPAPSQDGCPGVGQHEGPLVPVHRVRASLPDFNRFLYPAVVSVVFLLDYPGLVPVHDMVLSLAVVGYC